MPLFVRFWRTFYRSPKPSQHLMHCSTYSWIGAITPFDQAAKDAGFISVASGVYNRSNAAWVLLSIQHELVGVYSASERYQNNIKLGTHGRYRDQCLAIILLS